MIRIETIEALEALYGTPKTPSLAKVAGRITPGYGAWLERSRFCILSTVGPEGTDASPRGDDGPVVTVLDPGTLALPDWRGNDRIDSLRNIVADGRVSLMFMVPGAGNVIRVNGQAVVTADDALLARFERKGVQPRSVIVVTVGEVYFQCARAIMRSEIWAGEDLSHGLPTPGALLSELSDGAVGGAEYDVAWPKRAEKTMW